MTLQLASLPLDLAVIIAVPVPLAAILPPETVATLVLLEVHAGYWADEFILYISPFPRDRLVTSRVII